MIIFGLALRPYLMRPRRVFFIRDDEGQTPLRRGRVADRYLYVAARRIAVVERDKEVLIVFVAKLERRPGGELDGVDRHFARVNLHFFQIALERAKRDC